MPVTTPLTRPPPQEGTYWGDGKRLAQFVGLAADGRSWMLDDARTDHKHGKPVARYVVNPKDLAGWKPVRCG